MRHQCTAAVNSALRSCHGASNRHRVPRLRLRAKATAVGCWAKPRSASCHVVAAFEQPLMSNSRLSRQAGRSELCHGQACRAGAVEEAYRGKRAAGESSDAPSGPACSRTMGPRNPRTPAANSVSQSCDGASSRRRCRAPRLRLRLPSSVSKAASAAEPKPRPASCQLPSRASVS